MSHASSASRRGSGAATGPGRVGEAGSDCLRSAVSRGVSRIQVGGPNPHAQGWDALGEAFAVRRR